MGVLFQWVDCMPPDDSSPSLPPSLSQLGYTGVCRNDSACQSANVSQLDADCAGALTATPTCPEACNASLAAVRPQLPLLAHC